MRTHIQRSRQIWWPAFLLTAFAAQAQFTVNSPALLNTNGSSDTRNDGVPRVATDGAGNWVAVWRSEDTLGGTIGIDPDVLVTTSNDNGLTWSAPKLLNTNGTGDSGRDNEPQVATDGAGNWVAVWFSEENLNGTAGTDYDIFFARSTDNGSTWSAPALLNTSGDSDSWLDAVPRITTDRLGRWIVVWYAPYFLGGPPTATGGDYEIFYSMSTDDGVTWSDPFPLNSNAYSDHGHEDTVPEIATDGAGTWVAMWYTRVNSAFEESGISVSTSTDHGATWSPPILLDALGTRHIDRDDSAPHLTTNGMGHWVAVWYSDEDVGGTAGSDWDLYFSKSTDNGATWSDLKLLNTNGNSDSHDDYPPQIATDGLGNWIAAWWSSENIGGSAGTDADIIVAYSTDNGNSWSDPALFAPNATTDSGGDGNPHLVADAFGNWLAVWSSGENVSGSSSSDSDILFSQFTFSPPLYAASPVALAFLILFVALITAWVYRRDTANGSNRS